MNAILRRVLIKTMSGKLHGYKSPYQASLVVFSFPDVETGLTSLTWQVIHRNIPRTNYDSTKWLSQLASAFIRSHNSQPITWHTNTTYALSNTKQPDGCVLNELMTLSCCQEPWRQAAPKRPTFHSVFYGYWRLWKWAICCGNYRIPSNTTFQCR